MGECLGGSPGTGNRMGKGLEVGRQVLAGCLWWGSGGKGGRAEVGMGARRRLGLT